MVVEISWIIKDHVLHVVIRGDASLEDADSANQVLLDMLNAADHPLHLIVETQEMGKYPLDPLAIRRSQTYLQHQKMGMVVVAGMNSVLRLMTKILAQVGVLRLQPGQDIQHALAFLYDNVPGLSAYPVQEIPIQTVPFSSETG